MIELINDHAFWVLGGALILLLETIFINSLYLLFISFAAILNGILIYNKIVPENDYITQAYVFCFATFAFGVILWKPLRDLKIFKNKRAYKDVVGTIARVVENDIEKGQLGKIKWSGTIVNAKIDEKEKNNKIFKDTEIEITKVDGNIFYIKNIQME